MAGTFQFLREKVSAHLSSLTKPRHACITADAMEQVLLKTGSAYPNMRIWEKLEHPRDNYFNIYVLPLLMPLHEHLKEPVQNIRTQMTVGGVAPDQRQLQSKYETRFSHLWIAEIHRDTYQAIGICTFHCEAAPGAQIQFGSGTGVMWWMTHAWLNPAQRNHHVLRNTVRYFEHWHPNFVVASDHPIVNRSLKKFPDHLRNMGNDSLIWE